MVDTSLREASRPAPSRQSSTLAGIHCHRARHTAYSSTVTKHTLPENSDTQSWSWQGARQQELILERFAAARVGCWRAGAAGQLNCSAQAKSGAPATAQAHTAP